MRLSSSKRIASVCVLALSLVSFPVSAANLTLKFSKFYNKDFFAMTGTRRLDLVTFFSINIYKKISNHRLKMIWL